MRNITGKIVLPPDAPQVKAKRVTVEVRDVSEADALSTVVAEKHLENAALKPNGRINFKLRVPEVESNRTLSLRVHVSLDGGDHVKQGDLLTTAHFPVPNQGKSAPLEVRVNVI